MKPEAAMPPNQEPYWSIPVDEVCRRLSASSSGLTSREAGDRLARFGPNLLGKEKRTGQLATLLAQFKTPLMLILIAAAILSFFLHDPTDASIILIIVFASGTLGFFQEHSAAQAVQKLLATIQTTANVIRDARPMEVALCDIVPGDVVMLSAGNTISGDSVILESRDLHINEASLTGETFPVEKQAGVLPPDTPFARRNNMLFLGTNVVSGTVRALIVATGRHTEFGAISERLRLRPPETEFERGIRHFGYLIMEVTLLLVGAIFAVNVYFERPVLEAFLFSLALAVGLTPQLLPAIISVNLAHGARRMAGAKAIVRRLASIENFGSMDVLCSDKTGTLTEGRARVHGAVDSNGKDSDSVLLHAYLNATFESGFTNPIDDAIRKHTWLDLCAYRKLDEVPYDFIRKRLSILVQCPEGNRIVTKGALENVLIACSDSANGAGVRTPLAELRDSIEQLYRSYSEQGFRTLGVACRDVGSQVQISADDESGMTFLGFIVVEDPPKQDVAETVRSLSQLGITLKIITGDNRFVAAHVARHVCFEQPRIFTGHELGVMSDEALVQRAPLVDVFAEVEPNQKERIIVALKKGGHVVGYLGDGINDASALHAADVGISVDSAVDVAKDAADIVLLEKDLGVLIAGVKEGRATFANTLKYVFMATSANFGNMFSMAGASLFLPFLPLLPKQILLMNLLTDLPEMTIAMDDVDPELVERPRRWDVAFIRRFMVAFGLLSSIFDFLTFGVLLVLMRATTVQFRTCWFVESMVSATLVVLVVRTRRPFFKSRPSRYLIVANILAAIISLVLPLSPLAGYLGFSILPWSFVPALAGIVVLYIMAAEKLKREFYRRVSG